MKLTLLLMLLAGPAFAGGGSFFGPGGGDGASSSTGTHTDGASASFKNATAETLASTGTAPSLTATGAVFRSSVSVLGTGPLLGVGAGVMPADQRALQASDYVLVGHPANSSVNRSTLRWTGAGTSAGPSAAGADADGDRLLFYNDGTGKLAIGLDLGYGMWFQANGGAASKFAWWLGTGGTPTEKMRLDASGNLGIGTASPGAKLHVSSGTLILDGNSSALISSGTITATNNVGVQIVAKGSGNGSSSDVQGHIQVGGVAANALRLEYGGLGVAEAYISNSNDSCAANDAGISIRTRTAGTAVTNLRAACNGGVGFYSRSIAQLLAITPDAVGTMFFCNNCSPAKMVVSTGTNAGNFADAIGGAFQ